MGDSGEGDGSSAGVISEGATPRAVYSSFSSSVDPAVIIVREKALDILRKDYPKVKDGVLSLEVFMRRKSRKAVYELRDFMAHFAKIFEDGISEDDAEHNFSECRTHLRRCVVEPLEYKAEKGFVRLDRLTRYFGWVIWRAPQAKKDFHKNMFEVKKLIASGRHVKAEGDATGYFLAAFEKVQELQADVGPIWYTVRAILALIVIFLAGLFAEAGKDAYLNLKAKHFSTKAPVVIIGESTPKE